MDPKSTQLVTQEHAAYSDEQRRLVTDVLCKGASPIEVEFFLGVAKEYNLSALKRQIYAVKRWDAKEKRETLAFQVGIEGLRSIASRTGEYVGSDDPVLDGWEGWHPIRATCTVWRFVKGEKRPFTATAWWDESVQTTRDGTPTQFWKNRPRGQLSKCYDDKTEVLTAHGFRLFKDVDAPIMTVTEHGLRRFDAKPFAQFYEGSMVTWDSDDLNFCVTPNHSMVTTLGRIDAGVMLAVANAKKTMLIPRLVAVDYMTGTALDDNRLALASVVMCDGYRHQGKWHVGVSRKRKIDAIESLGLHVRMGIIKSRDKEAVMHDSGRVIKTNFDKNGYVFEIADTGPMFVGDEGKVISLHSISTLSSRQAKIFTDMCIAFDGSINKTTGVRRFYASDTLNMDAFELAAIKAGYAVSNRSFRQSEGNKKNYCVSISSRDAISISKWQNNPSHPSIHSTDYNGLVWCVTVPSGEIIVRRNGFSMRCGNCAEAAALRKGFPEEVGALYVEGEVEALERPEPIQAQATAISKQPTRPVAIDSTSEVVTGEIRPECWSDLLTNNAWRNVAVPAELNLKSPTVGVMIRDRAEMEQAWLMVKDDTNIRWAMDCSRWIGIERALAAMGMDATTFEQECQDLGLLKSDQTVFHSTSDQLAQLAKATRNMQLAQQQQREREASRETAAAE